MPTSPGPLLQALDVLWARLRIAIPDLPKVRIAVAPTPSSSNHGPERWIEEEGGLVSGLVVTASTLDEGEEAVLECILHEAAHLLNWARGLKDTTMRGGYHNAQYLAAAEEVGLTWPDDKPRQSSRGYAAVELTDAARARYAGDLSALAEAIPQVLPHLQVPEAPKSRQPDRLTLRCKCDKPRNIRVSQTVAALGPITCGVCGASFSAD